ncbi:hypothetical protein AYO47_04475 [Planctomyces sp. SCGC AG-212-M04]|nr:hypothetical protein AYO47_04475 [Planctomyces sp. SCGC AG-212-M04]
MHDVAAESQHFVLFELRALQLPDDGSHVLELGRGEQLTEMLRLKPRICSENIEGANELRKSIRVGVLDQSPGANVRRQPERVLPRELCLHALLLCLMARLVSKRWGLFSACSK